MIPTTQLGFTLPGLQTLSGQTLARLKFPIPCHRIVLPTAVRKASHHMEPYPRSELSPPIYIPIRHHLRGSFTMMSCGIFLIKEQFHPLRVASA
ncbi:hypothetical protein ASPTUDRAFT_427352 [Aspergillus tubingensis CBS 134.48]|uniref:Uncharacterized protein n=1 Tax=Aspergillus tubingensis (strain CBS 134.48) TaxID=767770 RepID=A0A1L9NEG7_ASPTC|nr:hypothetical protein ASPTUDRAFT_427352 [Aspergillus tubingensis CBS 134.48]